MESVRNREERSRGKHSGFIKWLRKAQCNGFPHFVHVPQISRREAPVTPVTVLVTSHCCVGQPSTALQALLDATPPRVWAVRSDYYRADRNDTKQSFAINDTGQFGLLPAHVQNGYDPPHRANAPLPPVSRAIFSVFTPSESEDRHCRGKNTWSYSSTVLRLLWVATHGGGAAGRAMGQRCQATERPTRC